jgi:hypothetical protein
MMHIFGENGTLNSEFPRLRSVPFQHRQPVIIWKETAPQRHLLETRLTRA